MFNRSSPLHKKHAQHRHTERLWCERHTLAEKLGVNLAILAGRVRHETRNYRILIKLLGKAQVSRHLALL